MADRCFLMTMAVTFDDASVDDMQASSRTSECRRLLICWLSGPQGRKLMKLLSSCSRGDIQAVLALVERAVGISMDRGRWTVVFEHERACFTPAPELQQIRRDCWRGQWLAMGTPASHRRWSRQQTQVGLPCLRRRWLERPVSAHCWCTAQHQEGCDQEHDGWQIEPNAGSGRAQRRHCRGTARTRCRWCSGQCR
jgi:hypothetical protein